MCCESKKKIFGPNVLAIHCSLQLSSYSVFIIRTMMIVMRMSELCSCLCICVCEGCDLMRNKDEKSIYGAVTLWYKEGWMHLDTAARTAIYCQLERAMLYDLSKILFFSTSNLRIMNIFESISVAIIAKLLVFFLVCMMSIHRELLLSQKQKKKCNTTSYKDEAHENRYVDFYVVYDYRHCDIWFFFHLCCPISFFESFDSFGFRNFLFCMLLIVITGSIACDLSIEECFICNRKGFLVNVGKSYWSEKRAEMDLTPSGT